MKRASIVGLLIVLTLVFSSTMSALAQNNPCGTNVTVGDTIVVKVNWRAPLNTASAGGNGTGSAIPQGYELTVTDAGQVACSAGVTYVYVASPDWTGGKPGWIPDYSAGSRIWELKSTQNQPTPTPMPTAEATTNVQDVVCINHIAYPKPGEELVIVKTTKLFVRPAIGMDNTPLWAACQGSTFIFFAETRLQASKWFEVVLEDGVHVWIAEGLSSQYSEIVAPAPEGTAEASAEATAEATATPVPCEAALPCQLAVGMTGQNNAKFGETHLRTDPKDPGTQMGFILTGNAYFTVVGGPECHMSPKHGVTICWWQIEFVPAGFSASQKVTAWAPEGIPDQRWLLPVKQ